MQDVNAWLGKKPHNYEEGVRIYLQYNRTPLFVALFKEEETAFKRAKLLELMNELLNDGTVRKTDEEAPGLPTTPQPHARYSIYKSWPDPIADRVVQSLFDQARPLYAEMMSLQQRIHEVALQGEQGNTSKEMEAGRMAHRILDLSDELEAIYTDRDFYLKNNHLPETRLIKDEVVDPVKWAVLLKNAERYVRDYKQKLRQSPTHKNAPKWAEKLTHYEAEVVRLQKLLKL